MQFRGWGKMGESPQLHLSGRGALSCRTFPPSLGQKVELLLGLCMSIQV